MSLLAVLISIIVPTNLISFSPALAALTLNDLGNSIMWLPDTGASAHMTNNASILHIFILIMATCMLLLAMVTNLILLIRVILLLLYPLVLCYLLKMCL